MDIVETFHTVCCGACVWELVAGLLRPRLFLLAIWAKLKLAAQLLLSIYCWIDETYVFMHLFIFMPSMAVMCLQFNSQLPFTVHTYCTYNFSPDFSQPFAPYPPPSSVIINFRFFTYNSYCSLPNVSLFLPSYFPQIFLAHKMLKVNVKRKKTFNIITQ